MNGSARVTEVEADSTGSQTTGRKTILDCRTVMSVGYVSRRAHLKARKPHHGYDCVIQSWSGFGEGMAYVRSHHPSPNHARGRKRHHQRYREVNRKGHERGVNGATAPNSVALKDRSLSVRAWGLLGPQGHARASAMMSRSRIVQKGILLT